MYKKDKNSLQKTIINLIFKGLVVFSVLVIIEGIAKFSFKYLYPSAENTQETASRQFEKENKLMLSQDTSLVWFKSYWENYYKAVQLRFPQTRLPKHKALTSKYLTVNQEGWRNTPLPYLTNNNSVKILFFGNSTLWGVGSPDSLTIPAIFAQKLSQIDTLKPETKNANIQNFAVCSWNFTQMLVQLEVELKKGNVPQTVIFLSGATDLSRTLVEGGMSETQNYEILSQKVHNKVGLDSNFIATNIDYILQRANMYKLLKKWFYPSQYRLTDQNYQQIAKAIATNYFKNYEIINSLSKQYRFNFVVYWQPFSLKRAEELHPEDVFFRNFALAVNEEISKESQKNNYSNFYNFANILQDKKGKLFLDYCHLTTLGNEYLAEEMLKNYVKAKD